MDWAALYPALVSLAAGSGLLGLVGLGLRAAGRQRRADAAAHLPASVPPATEAPPAGTLVAEVGGRLEFVDERARELLGLGGHAPHLGYVLSQVRPPEALLERLAAEGHSRLMIGPAAYQATSLRLPPAVAQGPARMLVVLQPAAAAQAGTAGLALGVAEVARAVAACLEPDQVLDTLLARLDQVVPFSVAEINLLDPATQALRPARHAGDPDYPGRLAEAGGAYQPGEGYTGWLARECRGLLVPDTTQPAQAHAKLAGFGYGSYLGVPLLAGDELLGTLEVANRQPGAYGPADLAALELVASQAAAAWRNGRLAAQQEQRVAELTGLAELTRALGKVADPHALYGRLVAEVARLLDVSLAGFLAFDPQSQALVGQPPFYGFPDVVAEIYRVAVPPGSPAEQLWREADVIRSSDFASDPVVELLGLRDFAVTTGTRATLIMPVAAGEQRLGWLQVANKTGGTPFGPDDEQLLKRVAAEAAALLDHARLVQAALARAAEAEHLRAIAQATSGQARPGAGLDATLRAVMAETAQLLGVDFGMVILLDEARGALVPHPASVLGGPAHAAQPLWLRTDDPLFAHSVTATRRPFVTGRAPRDRRLVGYYRTLVERFEVHSAMDVPLVAGDRAVGELLVAARRPRAFTRAHLATLGTIAAQVAAALERDRLYAATDQSLQRRVDQLTALTRVGRELNQTLELERILRLVYDEVVHTTGATCGSIVLLDLEADDPGRAPVAMRYGDEALGHDLTALEAEVATGPEAGQPRRVAEVAPGDPLAAHAGVVAALVVPIMAQGMVVGLVHLHRPAGEPFDASAEEAAAALAGQMAIAVENARRFDDQKRRGELLRRRADQLAQLFQVSRSVRSDRPLAANLEAIALAMAQAVGFEIVLISALEARTGRLRRLANAGLPLSLFETIRQVEPPWHDVERLLRPAFRISQSYLVPAEQAAEVGTSPEAVLVHPPRPEEAPSTPNAWQPDDMLLVPLLGSGQEPIGLLSVDGPSDGRRPSRGTIEIIEIFANQAARAIENARLYEAAQRRASQLLALHRVVKAASAVADRSQLWATVAETLLAELPGPDVCLIALAIEAEGGPRLEIAGQAGQVPAHVRFGPLLAGANPLGQAGRAESTPRQMLSVTDDEWALNPFVMALGVGSFVSVPIFSQGAAAGALFVGAHHRPTEPSPFTAEDLDVFTVLANQLGAALDNARLFESLEQHARDLDERTQRLARLNRFSAQLSQTLSAEPIQAITLSELCGALEVERGTLVTFGAEGAPALAARHPAGPPTPLALPALLHVRETGTPLASQDVAADERLGATGAALAEAGVRTLLVVPLAVAGQVLAAVQLEAGQAGRHFSPAEIELAQTLANQAAVAAQNARLYAETQHFAQELEGRVAARTSELERERRRVETLLQVTTELSSSLDLDLVLTRALQLVTDAVGATRASIFMLDLMTDQLIYRATLGGPQPVPAGGVPTRFRRYDGLIGYVVKHRKPVVIGDLSRELRWVDLPDHDGRYQSAMIAPLMAGEDALGAIVMLSTARNAFEARQLQLVAAAANQVGAAVNNAELYRLIRDQAERLGAMLRHQQVEATQSRAILEGIADGVLVANAKGEVILFNLACERLLGLQREAVIDRPLTALVGIYGPSGKVWTDAIERWRHDPDSYQPGEFVAQRIRPDDQHVISVHLAPVIANNDYLGSVSVIRDITREVEVDRLKSEFVSNVSHELRTPMTSIKGYADLLIMGAGGPLAPTQQRFLEVIKSNADRLSLLVNDLLDISRIESGKVELALRATAVPEVLQHVAATVRGHMDEAQKPMHVLVETAAGLPPVWADRERITQIIMNLADNAFNYTAAGGTITLRATPDAASREVVVEVVDTGLGIRPEDQARLFDRFYRGEEALVMAASGTGLGLSIARQLAEMHGGRLWLKSSTPGRGSAFALALPVAPAAEAEAGSGR